MYKNDIKNKKLATIYDLKSLINPINAIINIITVHQKNGKGIAFPNLNA